MKSAWITTLVGLSIWIAVACGIYSQLNVHRDGAALQFFGFISWTLGGPIVLLIWLNKKYPEPPSGRKH
jgi:tellurite resistance protein TehA-like permease